jgi:hypothetical protein
MPAKETAIHYIHTFRIVTSGVLYPPDRWLHKDSRLDFSDRSDPTAKVMRNIQENVLESQLKLTRRVERMEAKVDSQFAAIRTALEANSAAVLELKR